MSRAACSDAVVLADVWSVCRDQRPRAGRADPSAHAILIERNMVAEVQLTALFFKRLSFGKSMVAVTEVRVADSYVHR